MSSWWITVLVVSNLLSISLGFVAGTVWLSSVGRWPDGNRGG